MLGTIFHYAVVEPAADHDRCLAQRDGIIAMHERMGYRQGGAYNGHFCIHGQSWISYLGPNQASGHPWANLNLHAWCYLAGPDTPVTPEAQRAAYDLTLVEPTGRDQIYPHSAFFPTACCGDPLREWIAAGALASPAPNPHQEDNVLLVGRLETDPSIIVACHPVNGVLAAEFTCRVGEDVFGMPPAAADYANANGCGRGEIPIRFVLPHVITWLRTVQGYTLVPPITVAADAVPGFDTTALRNLIRDELDKTRLAH